MAEFDVDQSDQCEVGVVQPCEGLVVLFVVERVDSTSIRFGRDVVGPTWASGMRLGTWWRST